jgi:hypothetical protein
MISVLQRISHKFDYYFFSLDTLINKQDPTQVYLQACKQYQIHPFNTIIEGLNTNTLDLSEMSINDLDLKAICFALRVRY